MVKSTSQNLNIVDVQHGIVRIIGKVKIAITRDVTSVHFLTHRNTTPYTKKLRTSKRRKLFVKLQVRTLCLYMIKTKKN